jgi:hypothetical protein
MHHSYLILLAQGTHIQPLSKEVARENETWLFAPIMEMVTPVEDSDFIEFLATFKTDSFNSSTLLSAITTAKADKAVPCEIG